jgi:CRISPR-associated protein Cmr3
MKLVLKPVDTFFFRNHKSMNAGEDSFASGVFPPRPGTVYGALRSAYIHKKSNFSTFAAGTDSELVRWMGTPSRHGEFALQSIFLQDDQDLIFPLPLDNQVVLNTGGAAQAKPLRLIFDPEKKELGSDRSSFRLYGVTEEKSVSTAGNFVYRDDLIQSLLHPSPLPAYSLERWLVKEAKVGIAHNWRTRQAREGMFYSYDALRFKDGKNSSLVAFIGQGPDFSGVEMASLGAKQRPWSLRAESRPELGVSREDLVKSIEQTGIARIIIVTPALWKYGVRPACWDSNKDALLLEDREYPVLAAAIGRPLLEGGWDIVRRRPKPRCNAVPPGSVLYVEVRPGSARNLVDAVHEANFSDRLAQEGYGFALVGCGLLER